jgi:hypothetical protein
VPSPEALIFFAPGQEWRTLWDFAPDHARVQGIVDRYEIESTCTDYLGTERSTPSVLDWALFKPRRGHRAGRSCSAEQRTGVPLPAPETASGPVP